MNQTSLDLVRNLTTDHLSDLQQIFKNNSTEGLDKSEFTTAFAKIFQNSNLTEQTINLFDQITQNEAIRINWSNFLDFLVKNSIPAQLNPINLQLDNIISVPQTKRESIVKIVLLETVKYFCYAIITKHGRVGLYDGNLDFLTTYQVIMTREDIMRKEEHRRRRNRWITDGIFLRNVQMFVITSSVRSIIFYEASGLKHVPLWLVLSTPNIVESFAYNTKRSILFMGDDSGFVFSFHFQQPETSLLRKKYNDRINLFYWDQLSEEKEFVVMKRPHKLHQENIKHLTYFDDNKLLISCSKDPESSLVIKSKGTKSGPHVFKMCKGCNCFALSQKYKILVTGSDDGVLRLWNPIITSKPVGVIKGHRAMIVDVKIMEEKNIVMSCSSDGNLKVWQLQEEKCIQSLTINFPSFTVFGKTIEWGVECLYPGPRRHLQNDDVWRSPILVTCCNHIALIKYQDEDKPVLPPPPLQNSVLVPNWWTTKSDEDGVRCTDDAHDPLDPIILEKRLKDLEFILKKDFFADAPSSDIHFKIANLESKKLDMQKYVALGAPYLALELHQVNNLTLGDSLPTCNKKKMKSVAAGIERMLEDANCRDLIFSELSSSRSPRSSRSSVLEFEY